MKFICGMLLLLSFAQLSKGQNFVVNGGFETGALDNWTQTQGDQSGATAESHSGAYGCMIESRGTLEQVVSGLESGTDYHLTVWVKCGVGGRANFGANEFGRSRIAGVSSDTSWVRMEKRFRTGLENTTAVIFITNLRTGTKIYADDFMLVKDVHSAFVSSLPAPPKGFHWEKIDYLSDEFNEDWLDDSKWLKYHPYWNGREPSRYKPENTWVADGYLALENTSRVDDLAEVANPQQDVWVNAAVVTSKNRNVSYGYYEARVKESMISMMSAFWFQGKYSEIDVIENIGAPSNNNGNEKQMHMNTHFYPGGWANDQKTPRGWTMPYLAGEDFHVYGMWWIDERRINFYHNGELVAEIDLPGDYEEPMYMFFDTEVFTWEGLPTIESLNDPDRNTMYVDWVRSWELAPGEASNVKTEEQMPKQLLLFPNYPNPFNPETSISFDLPFESNIDLSVFNMRGRKIRSLLRGHQTDGLCTTLWDGRNDSGAEMPSGLYFCALQTGESKQTRKMALVR